MKKEEAKKLINLVRDSFRTNSEVLQLCSVTEELLDKDKVLDNQEDRISDKKKKKNDSFDRKLAD
jgi:hypothetical protein